MALSDIRDPTALDALITAMRDSNEAVGFMATAAICATALNETSQVLHLPQSAMNRIRQERTANEFMQVFVYSEETSRIGAAWLLGKFGDSSASKQLIECLNDRDGRVQQQARIALARIGGSGTVAQLTAALQDERANVRMGAAVVLGNIRDPLSSGPLIAALQDSEEFVRYEAGLALAKSRNAEVIEPLLTYLANAPSGQFQKTVESLQNFDDPRLSEFLQRRDEELQAVASAAARHDSADLLPALSSEFFAVRMAASSALGRLRQPAATPELLAAINDPTLPAIARGGAAQALGLTRDPKAVSVLTAALGELPDEAIWLVVSGLGATLDPRAAPPLIDVLVSHERANVRELAAKPLEGFRDDRVVEALIRALSDPSAGVRQRAARTLGTLQAERARAPLDIASKQDRSGSVRTAAAQALAALGPAAPAASPVGEESVPPPAPLPAQPLPVIAVAPSTSQPMMAAPAATPEPLTRAARPVAQAPSHSSENDPAMNWAFVFGLLGAIAWFGWWGRRIVTELGLETGSMILFVSGFVVAAAGFLGLAKSVLASVLFIVGAAMMAGASGQQFSAFINLNFVVVAALAIATSIAAIGAVAFVGYALGRGVGNLRGARSGPRPEP